MEIIVISDVHLGSDNCQCSLLLQFLKEIHHSSCEKLIINGDLFENTEHRLKKSHWAVLSKLRKMSDDMKIVSPVYELNEGETVKIQ